MSVSEFNRAEGPKSGIDRILTRLRHEGAEAPRPSRASSVSAIVPPGRRWPLPGLAPMTRVRTSFGDVHAVALRKGDLIRVRSGEFLPIVWLNRVLLDEDFLSTQLDSNPIRLRAGSLGQHLPTVDVMMSPRQIIAATPKSGLAEAREAAELTSRPGVLRERETGLSYTMFHLGEPADVYCEGIYLSMVPPAA